MAQRRPYALGTLVEDLLRLRAAAAELRPEPAADLATVERHLRASAGESVPGSVAARVLGVSHTAIAHRLKEGELLRGRRPSDVDLDDLVDAALRLEREGDPSPPLVHVLRSRLTEIDRAAADDAGVEPARLSRWLRHGVVRSADGHALDAAERRWLARSGPLVRAVEELTRGDDGIDTVVLFGSWARGDQRPESDVDLIVDGDVVRDARARAVLHGTLLERLGRDVEVSTLAEARTAPVVLLEAIHEGRPIEDTAGRWHAVVAAKQATEAQAAAERATHPARERAALAALGVGR